MIARDLLLCFGCKSHGLALSLIANLFRPCLKEALAGATSKVQHSSLISTLVCLLVTHLEWHALSAQVVEATLVRKLTEHVERIDTDMAGPALQGFASAAGSLPALSLGCSTVG